MKCKLCKIEFEKLARSHIFPKGFFGNLPDKANVNSYSISGWKRKRQSAIIDRGILCISCEKITSHLDDYAIHIFRDKKKCISIGKDENSKFIVFESVDFRKLRAFFASLLWRISASTEKEIKSLSIGNHYNNLITSDLLNDGQFEYIDVFSCYLSDLKHGAFMMPERIKIKPIDKNRDPQEVNGWQIEMPNLLFHISLDKRSHPLNLYVKATSELTSKNEMMLVSSSLNASKYGYDYFLCMETDEVPTMINRLVLAMKNHNRKDNQCAKRGRLDKR